MAIPFFIHALVHYIIPMFRVPDVFFAAVAILYLVLVWET